MVTIECQQNLVDMRSESANFGPSNQLTSAQYCAKLLGSVKKWLEPNRDPHLPLRLLLSDSIDRESCGGGLLSRV